MAAPRYGIEETALEGGPARIRRIGQPSAADGLKHRQVCDNRGAAGLLVASEGDYRGRPFRDRVIQSARQIQVGIVGLGAMGRRHLRLVTSNPECRLAAVADPAPQLRRAAAAAGAPWHASYERMIEQEQLDAVIVAAPTQLHAKVGLHAVGAGIPTLLEKPLAHSLDAGLDLMRASARHGVPVCVGHHRRFDPSIAAARKILDRSRIGRLVGVSGLWALRKPDRYFDTEWRRNHGGGPVLTNMIHDIDLLRHLCGEVRSIYAETGTRERGLEVEDGGAIVLRFESGAVATVSFSDAAASPWGWERATGENPEIPPSGQNCYQFFGTAGAFEFPAIRLWRTQGCAKPDWSRRIVPHDRPTAARRALADQLLHFCNVVRGKEQPAVGPDDAWLTLSAALAVLESSRRKRPVRPARLPSGANSE